MAKSVKVEWNGKKLAKKYREALADGLTAGAIYLQGEMKQNLSGPSPSLPGEYPGKDTGNLRRSITFSAASPDKLVSAAGVSAAKTTENTYALYLEFGTSKMQARPFLVRTLVEKEFKVSDVIISTARRSLDG